MKSPSFPPTTLTGELIALEPLSEGHWPGILAVGLTPDIWEWTINRVEDEAGLRRWFDEALAAGADGRAGRPVSAISTR
jgi:hypothetical protein